MGRKIGDGHSLFLRKVGGELRVHIRPEVHVQVLRASGFQTVSVRAANDGVLLTCGLRLGLNGGGSDETAGVSVRHDVEITQR